MLILLTYRVFLHNVPVTINYQYKQAAKQVKKKKKGSEINKTIGEGSDSILPAQAYQMFWLPENIFWNRVLLDLYYQVSSAPGISFTVVLSLYNGNPFSANSPTSATIVTSNIKERVLQFLSPLPSWISNHALMLLCTYLYEEGIIQIMAIRATRFSNFIYKSEPTRILFTESFRNSTTPKPFSWINTLIKMHFSCMITHCSWGNQKQKSFGTELLSNIWTPRQSP